MKTYLKKLATASALLLMVLIISACSLPYPPVLDAEETVHVKISEVMASNKATIPDASSNFPDWLELHNEGEDAVTLTGYVLTDGETRWSIPELTLEGGQYEILFCSSKASDQLTVPFSLSKNGETIILESPGGSELDRFQYSSANADVSLIKDDNDQVISAQHATPGYENSDEGYIAFQSSLSSGDLVINEVMSYNSWYLPVDYEYYDWIELKNVSSKDILLSDYYISDDCDDLLMYRLPEQTLAPGELFVILCADDSYPTFSGVAAPFGIDSEGDSLYVCSADGALSDYTPVIGLKYAGSYGRMDGKNGFFYFDMPSPQAENSSGARMISQEPTADTAQGVYDDISSLEVALSGQGKIYYTLDGSKPTDASTLYTEPLTLTATSVIRAVAIADGKLASTAATFSYIINEGHDLPVVSVAIDPADFNGRSTGIYSNPTQDWERAAAVAFFDGDDGFSLDCGIKIHGATSREAQDKKSFKLKFKNRYDGELNYDLFGNGVTVFSDVLLRAAQESSQSSHLRDILLHELASECYDGLPTQSYKFAVLYLNGQYWGIYSIREAHSQEHYANHYGYSADSVTMTQGAWDQGSPLARAYDYARNQDLSDPESFEQIKTMVDVDSLITWQIIQSYGSNMDINPPNVRFYYSTEDNIGRYALVDLDLALFNSANFEIAFETGYQYSYFLKILLYNDEYRLATIQRLSEFLNGPLSDENVANTLHSLAAEIRSEIPRDAERWDYDAGSWERDLGYIEGRLLVNEGMTARFASQARYFFDMSRDEWDTYFADLYTD